MAKNSPNKRKSQNNEVQTPKKQKLNESLQKTPGSNKKVTIPNKQNTPKGGGSKNNTPKSQKKNTPKEKLQQFTGTANLEEKPKQIKEDADSPSDESDYEVEQEIKPEKITKTMNEDNQDSDEADDSENDDNVEDDDENDEEDTIKEESDNAVNENSENDEKKQKLNKNENKRNTTKDEKPSKAQTEAEIKKFIENEEATKGKMRYVLFIGNLSYNTTTEDMKKHFGKGIEIKSVRIPVGQGPGKKPRGFGYLEVADKESYLKAMSMHHSFLNDRRINVLYTTGGKKNSANIKNILRKKNFKLNALRKDGKLDGSKKHSNKRSVRRAKKRSFETKTE